MDPQATLRDLLEALEERDFDRIDELADALLHWMEHRGFPPQTLGSESLGRQWHRSVATFVCYAAKSKVRKVRKRRKRGG